MLSWIYLCGTCKPIYNMIANETLSSMHMLNMLDSVYWSSVNNMIIRIKLKSIKKDRVFGN